MPRFAESFDRDIEDIRQYYNEHDLPESGQRLVAKILDKCGLLDMFPEMGRDLESKTGRKVPFRFIVCGQILIFYMIKEEGPVVIRAVHGRRDYLNILLDAAGHLEDL